MTKDAKAWLRDWASSYILGESRGIEDLEETVRECVEDATEDGITKGELETAAGGQLTAYIAAAIRAAAIRIASGE